MNRVQLALFPALLLGILTIVLLTSLAGTNETVLAASDVSTDSTTVPAVAVTPTPAPKNVTDSACGLAARYPNGIRQWCSLIEKYSRQYNLDANLIAAVMLQESGGNSKAYSKSGAVGLMQVMPRDGLAASFQCNGRPCFASRPSMAELYEPEFNISYGVRMLAGLIQKTGSNREALKSYGPIDVGYYYADKVLKIYETYK